MKEFNAETILIIKCEFEENVQMTNSLVTMHHLVHQTILMLHLIEFCTYFFSFHCRCRRSSLICYDILTT